MTTTAAGADVTRLRPRRTVVLTGGTTHLLAEHLEERLLADGDRVVVLVGDPAAVVEPERSRGRLLAVAHEADDPIVPEEVAEGVDVVVHIAAGPEEASLRGLSSATLGTLFALRLARQNDARLVVASLPGNADHLHADEALAAGYRATHDVDTVVARTGEVYGPPAFAGTDPTAHRTFTGDGRSPRAGVLDRMLQQAASGGVVLVEGDDDDRHALCFVTDVVEGLVGLMRSTQEGPVLLAPDDEVPTQEVGRLAAEATGARLRVSHRRGRLTPPSAPHHAVSGDAPWGWRPATPLEDGLARTVAGAAAAVEAAYAVPTAATPTDSVRATTATARGAGEGPAVVDLTAVEADEPVA